MNAYSTCDLRSVNKLMLKLYALELAHQYDSPAYHRAVELLRKATEMSKNLYRGDQQ